MVLRESLSVQAGVRSSGIDLGDVRRFQLALERSGQRFAQRIFGQDTPAADRASGGVAMTAGFSMKESVIKAAGGLPRGGRFTDIDVEPGARGPFPVRLTGAVGEWAERAGVRLVADKLVLTDDLVLSWAVALGRGGQR